MSQFILATASLVVLASSLPLGAQRTEFSIHPDKQTDRFQKRSDVAYQNVQFRNRIYRFPIAENLIKFFGGSLPDAVEIVVPSSFFTAIFHRIDPARWPARLVEMDDDRGVHHYITLPNEIFQWNDARRWPEPPVRGPLVALHKAQNFIMWRSQAHDIPKSWVYVTFEGRSDIYAQCNDLTFGKALHSCDVNWFDGVAIHRLAVPGDWLRNAPAYVDEYRRVISIPNIQ